MDQNRFAFYGSLRTGMELFEEYVAGTQFLEVMNLPGYRLFSLGEYPYAVRTDDKEKYITVELFHFLDVEKARKIHKMELEAGYYYHEIQHVTGTYGIYLFNEINPHHVEILGGDWVQYVRKIRF